MAPRKKKEEVKVQEPVSVTEEQKADQDLLDECVEHQSQSQRYLETVSSTWDEKESMLIGKLEDTLSKKTKNKVFDHRLSSIIFERAARVMAQNPKGKAYAVSVDDIGKNLLMNLRMNHAITMDTTQFSHLLKNRLIDLYSMVYGSMFSLEFWMVNLKTGYSGPQSYLIPIRDVYPQPGIKNVNDMLWFIVRTMMSTDSLRTITKSKNTSWKVDNINRLLNDLKQAKFEGDQAQAAHNTKSYVERTMYPDKTTDKAFPQVELFTEYRRGKWITWASQHTDPETSKNYLLRITEPEKPYDELLPICVKHCFPLIDSPIGLGEFERGKTLQYALNSLINLYLDGVKYSIFPPLAINPDNVVPGSIKWGSGERWFMNNPGSDVKPVDLSPRGIETFNQTYSFMLSALYNQAGTSEVSQSTQTTSGLGKTPQAVRLQAVRESARDEWDRFMIEDYLKEKYRRWVAMIANQQETTVNIRLFKREIEDIEATAPDVKQLITKYKSGERGVIEFDKSALSEKTKGKDGKESMNPVDWDYELEAGSTTKPNLESDQENLTGILKAALENKDVLDAALAKQGKEINYAELFSMWVKSANNRTIDSDKIIVPMKAVKPAEGTPEGAPVDPNAGAPTDPAAMAAAVAAAAGGQTTPGAPVSGAPVAPAPVSPEGGAPMPPETPATPPVPIQAAEGQGPFQDPAINELMMKVLGGQAGIPKAA